MGRFPAETRMGEIRKKKIRIRGGNAKFRLYRIDFCNVTSPDTGKTEKCDIKDVDDNPANRNFARRKIITKGAIIQTKLGKARVTSRPGQTGLINAVLIPGK